MNQDLGEIITPSLAIAPDSAYIFADRSTRQKLNRNIARSWRLGFEQH
jgi:hypothetical protein